MEEATVNLIIALQIEDLKSLFSRQKRKAKDGSALTDDQIALDLQKTELEK